MSRKAHSHKRNHTKINPKQQPSRVLPRSYDWRTKILVAVLAFALIGGGTFAQWKAIRSEAIPVAKSSVAAKTSALAKYFSDKSRATHSAIDDIPPEALHPQPPMMAGYNASSGGLPPRALPPGVVLPGMAMMQGGRTTAQGYGTYGQFDGVRQQFTGKERDNESGLDYFGSRYYSSAQGRFTSVDPENAGADPEDPQSWNGYAYARNNPLKYTDSDGRKYEVCDGNGKNCVSLTDEEFYRARREDERNGNKYTGNRDFYESGQVIVGGNLFYNYRQVSIDDSVAESIYQIRRQTAPIPKATGLFAVAGAAGGAAIASPAIAGALADAYGAKKGVDKLLEAAAKPDRNGLTSAGRALQKHADRAGSVFPKVPKNPASLNSTGQQIVEDIVTNPGSITRGNSEGGIDIIAPDGRAIRYRADGSFKGFREPNK